MIVVETRRKRVPIRPRDPAPAAAQTTKRASKRRQRLTDSNVGSLKREPKAYLVWDQPRDCGFAVLVQPTGSKSFYAYYAHAPASPCAR